MIYNGKPFIYFSKYIILLLGGNYMKSFWSYISNSKYSIGTTGQTVYLYDENSNEIRKFKDIKYGYTPMFSPDGKIFVVKSTVGQIAVYSLETFDLIKKFRFSKCDGGQDDGFCFSPDGKELYNIERHIDSCKSRLSVYDTETFELKRQVLDRDVNLSISTIEYDEKTDSYYILGFFRDEKTGVLSWCFVSKFVEDTLEEIISISEEEYDFYYEYNDLKNMGFTPKAYEWHFSQKKYSLVELKSMNLSLVELHKKYKNHQTEL